MLCYEHQRRRTLAVHAHGQDNTTITLQRAATAAVRFYITKSRDLASFTSYRITEHALYLGLLHGYGHVIALACVRNLGLKGFSVLLII